MFGRLIIRKDNETHKEMINKIKSIDDEFITVVKMDLQKLLKMIKVGKIRDAKTICAALTYATKNSNKL